jgi:iron complex transport system ATP-binding protein
MPQRNNPQPVLLRASGVSFAYNGTPVLEELAFELRAGEMVGLVGPNGTGKSTLLKLLSGLLRPRAGDIHLLDRPLSAYGVKAVARVVAHVPQATAFDFPFTVREMVLMGRSPYLGRFAMESEQDRRVAEDAMRRTETLSLARRFINTLSGGERQRVLIARALAQQPRVLLLDEPTSNLDIKHQLALLTLVRDLAHRSGIGVVAAIHDLPLAARFCDRVTLLAHGRIVADGRPDEVFTPYRLAEVFGVEVTVDREPITGGLRLVPLRPAIS